MTNHPGNDRYPNWAPDGKHIVFFSDRDGDGNIWIYSMELSSKLTVRLASGGSPFWGGVVSDDKKRPPEALTPTTDGNLDPKMYDDFNNSTYDGIIDHERWKIILTNASGTILQEQKNLVLVQVSGKVTQRIEAISLNHSSLLSLKEPILYQAEMKLGDTLNLGGISLDINIGNHSYSCKLSRTDTNCQCYNLSAGHSDNKIATINSETNKWYLLGIQIDELNRVVNMYVDNQKLGSCPIPADGSDEIRVFVQLDSLSDYTITGYVDNFRVIEDK